MGKALQLEYGKFAGLFIADVPDSYLDELEKQSKTILAAINHEKEYRKTYKKHVDDELRIHFGEKR